MRSVICVVLLAMMVAVVALESRQNAVDKMLRTRLRRLNPRNDVILRPIKARVFPYFEDISFVSSPCFDPKTNIISVDTGSSDLWINANLWCNCDKASVDPTSRQMCAQIESYFSKNRKEVDKLEYADSLTVWGNYVHDALYYGKDNTVLEGAWFMAATNFQGSNTPGTPNGVSGMVGLGYIRNQGSKKRYSTLPYLLLENKQTLSAAFSMWFEPTSDEEEFIAQLIFGGYAQGIYKGAPETFDIVGERSDRVPMEIKIKLDQIQVRERVIRFPLSGHLKVLLDTGSYSSWLPLDTFKEIAYALGRHTIDWNAERIFAVYEDCSSWDLENEMMEFQFGQTVIRVPLSEIVREPTEEEVQDKDYSGTECVTHGIAAYADYYSWAIVNGQKGSGQPQLSRDCILGVTFLRYAYILYDLPATKIHMAAIDQDAVKDHRETLYTFRDDFIAREIPLTSGPNQ